jgi:hypothetical protein
MCCNVDGCMSGEPVRLEGAGRRGRLPGESPGQAGRGDLANRGG